jgi:hypothetical protein
MNEKGGAFVTIGGIMLLPEPQILLIVCEQVKSNTKSLVAKEYDSTWSNYRTLQED